MNADRFSFSKKLPIFKIFFFYRRASVFICGWISFKSSEYQLITYSGPTTESLNKPTFHFNWLLLGIHWHICEAHFQLMFDKECLPERLFFVKRKDHFPKFWCWSYDSFSSYFGLLFGNRLAVSTALAFHFHMLPRFLFRIHQGLYLFVF